MLHTEPYYRDANGVTTPLFSGIPRLHLKPAEGYYLPSLVVTDTPASLAPNFASYQGYWRDVNFHGESHLSEHLAALGGGKGHRWNAYAGAIRPESVFDVDPTPPTGSNNADKGAFFLKRAAQPLSVAILSSRAFRDAYTRGKTWVYGEQSASPYNQDYSSDGAPILTTHALWLDAEALENMFPDAVARCAALGWELVDEQSKTDPAAWQARCYVKITFGPTAFGHHDHGEVTWYARPLSRIPAYTSAYASGKMESLSIRWKSDGVMISVSGPAILYGGYGSLTLPTADDPYMQELVSRGFDIPDFSTVAQTGLRPTAGYAWTPEAFSQLLAMGGNIMQSPIAWFIRWKTNGQQVYSSLQEYEAAVSLLHEETMLGGNEATNAMQFLGMGGRNIFIYGLSEAFTFWNGHVEILSAEPSESDPSCLVCTYRPTDDDFQVVVNGSAIKRAIDEMRASDPENELLMERTEPALAFDNTTIFARYPRSDRTFIAPVDPFAKTKIGKTILKQAPEKMEEDLSSDGSGFTLKKMRRDCNSFLSKKNQRLPWLSAIVAQDFSSAEVDLPQTQVGFPGEFIDASISDISEVTEAMRTGIVVTTNGVPVDVFALTDSERTDILDHSYVVTDVRTGEPYAGKRVIVNQLLAEMQLPTVPEYNLHQFNRYGRGPSPDSSIYVNTDYVEMMAFLRESDKHSIDIEDHILGIVLRNLSRTQPQDEEAAAFFALCGTKAHFSAGGTVRLLMA